MSHLLYYITQLTKIYSPQTRDWQSSCSSIETDWSIGLIHLAQDIVIVSSILGIHFRVMFKHAKIYSLPTFLDPTFSRNSKINPFRKFKTQSYLVPIPPRLAKALIASLYTRPQIMKTQLSVGPRDGRTDRWTNWLIEMRGHIALSIPKCVLAGYYANNKY